MKIAIVGMAFRFPGDLDSEERFWTSLRNAEDLVTTVSPDRWGTDYYRHPRRSEPGRSVTFAAGQLSRIDEFDAMFFGISPREARQMDPQQRLLLEMTWEAMENGGQVPANLAGSDCGVYIGVSSLDYGVRSLDDISAIDAYFMTGNTLSIAANRISYVFDLHGPSMAIDTACSSSMVALHQACQGLRNGESRTAIAGGVHLLTHPYPFIGFTKASMLSAGGRCKTFDASGDGYVRAEGGAILFLKPLDAALADGDPVHAVILASGVNTDGYKSGITIPKSAAQAALMQACCGQAGIQAKDIIYIEAHGTGTAVGDPIETAAIGEVIGKAKDEPLYIGSVKSNLGHLEPASGMAGLIKTVLCLKHRALPPTLHLHEPNPNIDFDGLNICPVTKYTPLAASADPLRMGVNSFGFGGANAHVLLEEHRQPRVTKRADKNWAGGTPPLFLSARQATALKALAGRYADLLADVSGRRYYDVAHTAAHRRQLLDQRLAVYGANPADVAARLRSFAEGQATPGIVQEAGPASPSPVAFVYSGNGAQWWGMGRKLLASSALFRDSIAEIDVLLAEYGDLSIMAELMAESSESRLHLTEVAQPALFAVQVGVTRMLRAHGLEASAALGHSVGEIAAAWAMGALDLRQAVCVIHERSSAQAETQGAGRMAAVALSALEARQEIAAAGLEHALEIAAYNSPKATTLSGSLAALEQIQTRLKPRRVFFQLLDLDYAFHSWHMDGLKPRILRDLATLTPSRGAGRFISTVTGQEVSGDRLDAHYWWTNIRQPVQFEPAVTTLAEAGYRVFVEVGPHAIMQRYVGDSLAGAGCEGRVLATLKRNDDGEERITEATYRAYLAGAPLDLTRIFPHAGRVVTLPNYPWQRERFWHEQTSEAYNLIGRSRRHPLLGYRLKDAEASWENQLDPHLLPYLRDHVVGGAIVLPAAAYAELALAASADHFGAIAAHEVEELEIRLPIVLDADVARTIRLELDPSDGAFQIKSRPRLSDDEWTVNAVGRLLGASLSAEPAAIAPAPPELDAPVLTSTRHYALCQEIGLDYGPAFQGLTSAWRQESGLLAALDLPPVCQEGSAAYLLHPVLTDACFQSLLALFQSEGANGRRTTYLPVRIGRLRLFRPGVQPRWCSMAVVRHSPHSVLADFVLRDAEGQVVAQLLGCRFRAAPMAVRTQAKAAEWVYGALLKPREEPNQAAPLPANTRLARQVLDQLGADAAAMRRAHHFAEAAPLLDALIGTFAQRALATHADAEGRIDLDALNGHPYLDWLLGVALEDGLAAHTEAGWRLSEDGNISPDEIWLTILGDNPSYLPELALTGRIGSHLGEILAGRLDGRKVAERLLASPLFDQLYESSPAYRAMNRALRSLVAQIANNWPDNYRLRILEIAPASRPLTRDLLAVLPAGHCDYVIADGNDDALARAEADFGHLDWVSFAKLDRDTLAFSGETGETATFDIVIAAHALQDVEVPVPALANLKSRLALNGLLVIMERQPDRFTDFIQGLRTEWWRQNGARLADGETWRERLREAGYVGVETVTEPEAGPLNTGVYLLLASNPDIPDAPTAEPDAQRWLLLADADPTCRDFAAAVGDALRERGQMVVTCTDVAAAALEDCQHVVQLAGLAAADDDVDPLVNQEPRCLATLDLVHALDTRTGEKARLWLLTGGGAAISSPDARQPFGRPEPAQAALWGFGRVIANEHPDLNCTLIDLRAPLDQDLAARLAEELLNPDGEDEVLLCPDSRHVTRMRRAQTVERKAEEAFQNVRLDFAVPGQLKNLQWHACPMGEPAEDEVEIQPKAVGLNFRDVMYAMGLLSDEAVENGFAGPSMGMELSGIVTRTGSGVTEFKPGDAVIAFSPSGFAKRAITKANSILAKPERWSFEEAATVPTVFFTVYYALHHLARVQPGERVLIHGAAGGVGIAAIQLARHLGAEIFATAGSDEKRDFVRLLGADHVLNSRSLAYADDILALTGGQGVDVVVNSLAGEAINRNFRILRPFGRFLELGKRDFYENTRIGLRPFKDNITYYGIDADQLMVERPELATRLFREMMGLFREGVLQPLPHRVFPAGRIVDAFRYMQQAKQIGKIVVSFQDHDIPAPVHEARIKPLRLARDASYLVTGGLGGFGLKTACWLAQHGAGHVVLLGRRGADAPEAATAVAAVEQAGARAHVMACDVADADRLQTVITEIGATLPPIRGIVHAAMVLDDGLIRNLDHDRFTRVLRPKVAGAWNLHRLTRHMPLDLFVLYSSATTFIGNPGQANYVAANAYLEALAAHRRALGLPATAVCWGAIADVGYLARNDAVKESLESRLGGVALASDKALAHLCEMIVDNRSGVAVIDFDWHTVSRFLPAMQAPRFAELRRNAGAAGAAGDGEDIHALLANHNEDEAREIIRDLLTAEIAQILRLPADRIPQDRSLYDIGMDSLMGVELVLSIEKRFGINLPAMALSEGPTIQRISERLVHDLLGHSGEDTVMPSADAQMKDMMAGMAKQHGLEVSGEEIDATLNEMKAQRLEAGGGSP